MQGQVLPNIFTETAGKVLLYEQKYESGEWVYKETARSSISITNISVKHRLENLILDYGSFYFVTSNNDTVTTNYKIQKVFETDKFVLTVSDSSKLLWYSKPSLQIFRTIQGELDTIQEIYLGIYNSDTIFAATMQTYLIAINISTFNSSSEIPMSNISDIWFTNQSRDSLNINVPKPSSIFKGNDTIHVTSNIWTGVFHRDEILRKRVKVIDGNYLTSLDWYFGSNRFSESNIVPPMMMAYDKKYYQSIKNIGYTSALDHGEGQSTAYTWSLDEDSSMRIHSVSVAIGTDPAIYDANSFNVFEELETWYGYHTNSTQHIGRGEKIDLATMEPVTIVPDYDGRYVSKSGSQNEYCFISNGVIGYTQKDSILYEHRIPSIVEDNGNVISTGYSNDRSIIPDGGNCAWDNDYFNLPADIAHQNSGDYHINSGLAVESWRNARLDTIINNDTISYNLGLIFYYVDTVSGIMTPLNSFTQKINFEVNAVAQHDVNFVEKTDAILITFWNNHQNTCDSLMGEFVVVKILKTDATKFNFEVLYRESIGYSDALGSSKIKILSEDTFCISNTGTADPSQNLFKDEFQVAIHKVSSDFREYTMIASMKSMDINKDSLEAYAYQIDYLPKVALSNPTFEINSWLSEDSSHIFLNAYCDLEHAYWNGSFIPIDSILSIPVDSVLSKPESWIYASGKYSLDTTRMGWDNYCLSRKISLKTIVKDILGLQDELSTSSLEAEKNLIIYPNPTNNILNIKNHSGNQTYIIYDITGHVCKRGPLLNQISLSELSLGIYILEVSENRKTEQYKIVIQ